MMKLDDQQQIREACRRQTEATVTQDFDVLRETIAPDAEFVHITGKHQTREEWIKEMSRGRMEYFNATEVDMEISIDGDTANVTSKNMIDARIYGFRNQWPLAAKTILEKRAGVWQVTSSTASLY